MKYAYIEYRKRIAYKCKFANKRYFVVRQMSELVFPQDPFIFIFY